MNIMGTIMQILQKDMLRGWSHLPLNHHPLLYHPLLCTLPLLLHGRPSSRIGSRPCIVVVVMMPSSSSLWTTTKTSPSPATVLSIRHETPPRFSSVTVSNNPSSLSHEVTSAHIFEQTKSKSNNHLERGLLKKQDDSCCFWLLMSKGKSNNSPTT